MKRALQIVGLLVALLLAAAIILPFVVNVNSFRPRLESALSSTLGREVKVGNLGLSILSGSVSAEDLSIADDPAFSKEPFVRAKSLKVGLELMPLIFSRQLHVKELRLNQPEIRLLQSPAGKWNFSSLGGSMKSAKAESSSNLDLSVKRLAVENGSLSLGRTNSSKIQTFKDVAITVENFSSTSQFPFTLSATLPGNGDLKLEGQAGPLANDAAETPLEAQITVKHLDVAASGFIEASSGISGMADFSGKVTSDGHEIHTNGDLTATKLKLAEKGTPADRPVEVKYAVTHNLQKRGGTLTQGDIAIGKAVAKLSGTYQSEGETMALAMKLNGQNMPVEELVAMLPALGMTLPSGSSLQGGTLSTAMSISGTTAKPMVTGPIRLAGTKLSGFSLGAKLAVVSQLLGGPQLGSDTEIQNLSTDVQYAPSGIQTQNINLTVPSLGIVTGNGSIAPGGAMDYKMNASVNSGVTAGLARVIGLGGGSKGLNVPFFIRGTMAKPVIEPDLKGVFSGKLKNGAAGQDPAQTVLDQLGIFGKKKKP